MRAHKPTRRELEAIRWTSPNPWSWLIKKRHNNTLTLVHCEVGTEKTIPMG
jgi:hypothetical protein